MTELAADFFDKRAEEINRWKSEGFVELHDLLNGTGYTLEDLELTGVLQKKSTFAGLENLDGHEATPQWREHFREGDYMTSFLSNDLFNRIMQILSNHSEVQKRVQHRQEVYRQRKVAFEKKRLLEAEKKEAERRQIEDKNLFKKDSLVENDVDEVTGQTPESLDSEISDNVRSNAERDSGVALSTTGLVAVPSMLLLFAIVLRHLGSDDSPGTIEWALIALFSYSPIRYVFRSGVENVSGQLKALAMGTVMLLVVGAGLSNCSGMSSSGPSCWYIVGCI